VNDRSDEILLDGAPPSVKRAYQRMHKSYIDRGHPEHMVPLLMGWNLNDNYMIVASGWVRLELQKVRLD
jgi:hypothetical protein